MKAFTLIGLLAVSGVSSLPGTALAADRMDMGKHEYDANCVACHCNNLKRGAYVDFLKVTPPDLTVLANKNGGVFPLERVYGVIDGRQEVRGHGSREMPIWGRDYRIKAGEFYADSYYDPESFTRGRILALIDYLNRMQEK